MYISTLTCFILVDNSCTTLVIKGLRRFTAVFFAHPIVQVFCSLKTRWLQVRIPPEA